MSRIPPFARGMAILALIAAGIVIFDQQQSLATAGELVRFAFLVAIAVFAYFLWRDMGRREISLWPALQQRVFYSAAGLLLVDLGWFFARSLSGPNFLAFILVAAACIYAGVRIWREQQRYS
ncbi:MAG TPA: hypothetical protein VGM80_15630 [Gaiellaceae bacterium]|jgi:hypothetical protein